MMMDQPQWNRTIARRLTRALFVGALALGATALTAAPAAAEDDLPPTSEFFDEFDGNADGKVTQDEFRGSSEIFRLIDKNGDGTIVPSELGLPADFKPDPAAQKRRAQRAKAGAGGGEAAKRMEQFRKRIMTMDADKDGRVSKAEWKGQPDVFDRIDRNKDGFLDAKDARGGKNRGKARKPGGEMADGPTMSERQLEGAKQRFADMDKNADGKLAGDEVPDARILKAADKDGDGAVSVEEFLGFVKARGKRGGADRAKGGKGKRGGGQLRAGALRRWDRNRDGKVSPDEFPGRDAAFARYDVDKDGFLTEADIAAMQKGAKAGDGAPQPAVTRKSGNLIETQDTDGDGKLHRAEFQGSSEDWRRLDANSDGWVTREELGLPVK